MNGRINQVGFSQRIQLEWFEQTTRLILAGNSKAAVKDSLQGLLLERVSVGSDAVRGNRGKVITILMKTWLTVPFGMEPLRDEGLNLLRGLNGKDRIVLHWGMASAAYPFWSVVAAYTGRLLRLQRVATAAQIQRRVRERYGERETAVTSRPTGPALIHRLGSLGRNPAQRCLWARGAILDSASQTDRLDAGSVSASPCEAVRPHEGSDRESEPISVSYSARAGRTCCFSLPSPGYPAARDE